MNSVRMIALTTFLSVTVPCAGLGQVFTQHLFGGGYLGVQVRDVTASEVSSLGLPGERGVFVIRSNEESPAARAGLKEGDVILEFGQFQVFSVRQFQRLVSETPPGRRVQVSILRQGKSHDLEATIDERSLTGDLSLAPAIRIPGLEDLRSVGPSRGEAQKRPRLGISGQKVTPQLAEALGVTSGGGILVMEVHPGSPADNAGLQAGDVLTSVNGNVLREVGDLTSLLDSGPLRVKLVRNRETLTLTIELETPPEKGEKPMRL